MKLFMYTEKAKVSQYALRAIRRAGYLPIQVSSVHLADVKWVDTEESHTHIDKIGKAALRTIQDYGNKGNFSSVRAMFGTYVAEEMNK